MSQELRLCLRTIATFLIMTQLGAGALDPIGANTQRPAQLASDFDAFSGSIRLASIPDEWRTSEAVSTSYDHSAAAVSLRLPFSSTNTSVRSIAPRRYVIEQQNGDLPPSPIFFKLDCIVGEEYTFELRNYPFTIWGFVRPYVLDAAADFGGDAIGLKATTEDWRILQGGVWLEGDSLVFKRKARSAVCYFAMRLPYTSADLSRLVSASATSSCQILKIGPDGDDGNLAFVFGIPPSAAASKKPVLLIYAREHCDESDASWVADGVVRYLLSRTDDVDALTSSVCVIVIPILSKKHAIMGDHLGLSDSFGGRDPHTSAIALQYMEFFRSWVDSGKRLDVVLNLHNQWGNREWQMFCPELNTVTAAASEAGELHRLIVLDARLSTLRIRTTAPDGQTVGRLGSWLAGEFGATHLPYEVNSRSLEQSLSPDDLRGVGRAMCLTTASFLSSSDAIPLLTAADNHRRRRGVHLENLSPAQVK